MSPWPFLIGADGMSLAAATWITAALGAVEGDAATEGCPTRGWILGLDVRLSAISGAGAVTFYLSEDEDGKKLLSPHSPSGATQSVSLAKGSMTEGGVSWFLSRKTFVCDAIFVHLCLDAGTATGAVRLSGETGSAWRARP